MQLDEAMSIRDTTDTIDLNICLEEQNKILVFIILWEKFGLNRFSLNSEKRLPLQINFVFFKLTGFSAKIADLVFKMQIGNKLYFMQCRRLYSL